jgi:hypothetical protein
VGSTKVQGETLQRKTPVGGQGMAEEPLMDNDPILKKGA